MLTDDDTRHDPEIGDTWGINTEAGYQFTDWLCFQFDFDYLLNSPYAEVTATKMSVKKECSLNQHSNGEIIVPRFGASDCKNGCGPRLKYNGFR